jgi:hypothetical protein
MYWREKLESVPLSLVTEERKVPKYFKFHPNLLPFKKENTKQTEDDFSELVEKKHRRKEKPKNRFGSQIVSSQGQLTLFQSNLKLKIKGTGR